ncbi:peptidyl-prolyl cis-trans isomerase-like 4. ppil4 [Schistosoma mansoni]|uniref:peptidyl-prolyl cis-trans isomerase-like 4. ppil4 n=1 Tax=Schistosoma mansoni TaxID=6183 RepID=UPI00022DCC1E|nr:peptidyl-prolyl cis-trans isomerase-like 4. ppil4 [Schistosoma mansoni]|eukprot:XP_018654299.1 peptidyl-prolyl cis-trans isomerase-like 4. ppil4 [Schistosoma mansoni]
MAVLLETSLGQLVLDLYCEEKPRTCTNFIKLCKMKHFNFCLFHCVQKNLVAQSGDPSGTGRGGWSFFKYMYGDQARYFDAERKPKISHTRKGLVSMVDNGSGQHGSQFFITLGDDLNYLDDTHTVFGYIAEGMDFVEKINEVYCDKNGRPFRNVRIHHTIVIDDPFDTPKMIRYPDSPQSISISTFDTRLEEDEELDDTEGLSLTQLGELRAEQEVKTHTQLLTLIGDLPDANVKPPNNVLFVCKLNPVTTSEDLGIIFSRFGEIKSCEVIRDKRTGASLQYAFIEYEKEADCEDAYFKMDKVVIDDRRIHVDFSQSVAREWQSYRKDKLARVQPQSFSESKESRDIKESCLPRSPERNSRRNHPQHSHSHENKRKKYSPVRHRSPSVLGEEYDLVISDESDSSSLSVNSQGKSKWTDHSKFLKGLGSDLIPSCQL